MKVLGRILACAVGAVLLGTWQLPAMAATPDAAALRPLNATATWQGSTFKDSSVGGPKKCDREGDHKSTCDHFRVTVDVPKGYWNSHQGGLRVSISWTSEADNFDLYAYDREGHRLASSRSADSTGEQLYLPEASGEYEVRVVPKDVSSASYAGVAHLMQDAHPAPGYVGGSLAADRYFVYGVDRTSWYWAAQVVETLGTPPNDRTLWLPNPQLLNTLPVGQSVGTASKSSSVFLDLSKRGVVKGSKVGRLKVTISSQNSGSGSGEEVGSFNALGKGIKACRITSSWTRGAAELIDQQPSYKWDSCVAGTHGGSGSTSAWTFNLTSMAGTWASDPSTNHGFLLLGTGGGTWQANLKIPSSDDGDTSANEYEQTKTRLVIDLAFTKPPAPKPTPTPTPTPSSNPTHSSSTGSGGSSGFVSGSSGFVGGSSGFTGGFGQVPSRSGDSSFENTPSPLFPTTPVPSATPSPGPFAGGTPSSIRSPEVPWIVWVLIPIMLLAAGAVRALTSDPTPRPSGVIAGIAARNAAIRPPPPPRPQVARRPPLGAASRAVIGTVRGVRSVGGKGLRAVSSRLPHRG